MAIGLECSKVWVITTDRVDNTVGWGELLGERNAAVGTHVQLAIGDSAPSVRDITRTMLSDGARLARSLNLAAISISKRWLICVPHCLFGHPPRVLVVSGGDLAAWL